MLPPALKKTFVQDMEERKEEAKATIEVGAFILLYCASRKMVITDLVSLAQSNSSGV